MTTNMNVYYTEQGQVYLIPNHYSHTLEYIDSVLEYAKTIGLTLPERKDIRVEVLTDPRYRRMLSVEFNSITKPNTGMLLTPNSGLWEWLTY